MCDEVYKMDNYDKYNLITEENVFENTINYDLYSKLPFFRVPYNLGNRCPRCERRVKYRMANIKLYDDENNYISNIIFSIYFCYECDISYATEKILNDISLSYPGLHAETFKADIYLNQKDFSENVNQSPQKRQHLKNNKSILTFPTHNQEEMIPEESMIYVLINDEHECIGKMVGTPIKIKKYLFSYFRGKIDIDIKKCPKCKKLLMSIDKYNQFRFGAIG